MRTRFPLSAFETGLFPVNRNLRQVVPPPSAAGLWKTQPSTARVRLIAYSSNAPQSVITRALQPGGDDSTRRVCVINVIIYNNCISIPESCALLLLFFFFYKIPNSRPSTRIYPRRSASTLREFEQPQGYIMYIVQSNKNGKKSLYDYYYYYYRYS